jgi:hypothetical protein
MEDDRRLVEPLQIRVEPAAPGVAVGLLLQDARLLLEADPGVVVLVFRGAGDGRREREVGPGVEGRVDVDQIHLPGELV